MVVKVHPELGLSAFFLDFLGVLIFVPLQFRKTLLAADAILRLREAATRVAYIA